MQIRPIIAFTLTVVLATHCFGQTPDEVQSVLQQLSAKRDQQRAIYDAAMEKANRIAEQ
ncbi:hypothetical protein Pla52nx_005143 [Stieleria varia]|uniref:hypothetical protein n=1 Tax=Stieleria varia TaxID=2528005 RepID=UPI00313B217A